MFLMSELLLRHQEVGGLVDLGGHVQGDHRVVVQHDQGIDLQVPVEQKTTQADSAAFRTHQRGAHETNKQTNKQAKNKNKNKKQISKQTKSENHQAPARAPEKTSMSGRDAQSADPCRTCRG